MGDRGVLISKVLQVSFLILFIFCAGCSSVSTHDDNEAAAIVKGQEITIGDLRFLYPDDTALDYLDWLIKVELVKQIRKFAESQAKQINKDNQ